MHSEKPMICTPPRLSEVSPTLPLKWFQCSSDWQWPSIILSSFLFQCPSLLGHQRCDVLGFVPTGSVSSFSTLPIFWEALVTVALPASLSAQSFPFTPACPGQYTHWSFEGGCWPSTHSSLGFPFHFSLCSKLTESVKMMASVVWLSPLEAIQWRMWRTASACIVKLKVETEWFSWMVVVPCSSTQPRLVFGDNHQCTLWDLAVCHFCEWEPWVLALFCQLAILTSDKCFPNFSGRSVS